MSNRLMLKGALGEKKMARMKLANRAERKLRLLDDLITEGRLGKLREVKGVDIRATADELCEALDAYRALAEDIAALEKELD